MAVDKLVDSTQLDADLTSVANAIRTKGGTSADLAFPAGFVSAVQAIPTGGGGGGGFDMASGTITPSSTVNTVSVAVDFEPQYALCFVDPYSLAQTSDWKNYLNFSDMNAGFATGLLARYLNNAVNITSAGLRQTDIGSYSDGLYTFVRAGNFGWLSGVTYTWFCWAVS